MTDGNLITEKGTWECHPEGANYLIQASLGIPTYIYGRLNRSLHAQPGHEQRDAETFAAWGGDYLK